MHIFRYYLVFLCKFSLSICLSMKVQPADIDINLLQTLTIRNFVHFPDIGHISKTFAAFRLVGTGFSKWSTPWLLVSIDDSVHIYPWHLYVFGFHHIVMYTNLHICYDVCYKTFATLDVSIMHTAIVHACSHVYSRNHS